jgi:flavin reductase (DIM6/NTAB) family NADH-FMN oxidoreductase RutF
VGAFTFKLYYMGFSTAETAQREEFVQAMRAVPAPVGVITTWVGTRAWGMTVTAFCSVSADPPRILVSVGNHTETLKALSFGGRFGFALLTEGQIDLADFSARPAQPKFIEYHLSEGSMPASDEYGWHGFPAGTEALLEYYGAVPGSTSPIIAGAYCRFECMVQRIIPAADHSLVIGDVTAAHCDTTSSTPLLYAHRTFHRLGLPIRERAPMTGSTPFPRNDPN